MPTTPRKSAAAKPAADASEPDSAAAPRDTKNPASATPHTEPDPAATPDSAPEPKPASAGEGGAKPADDKPAGAAAAEPAAQPSFHWETATGLPGDPCRECNPAGPPPGAGSIGCAHGQWVRVADTTP